jgi:Nucleotidyltransferase of unknown function (DUF6036)
VSKTTANRRPPVKTSKRLQRTPPRALVAQLRRETNELKKKMLLLGYLSDQLSRRGAFIFLVGGQAVETYTAGQFTTGDIDITTTDQQATEKLLTQLGFKREGMIWLNERLAIAVHIVGSYPTRTEKLRTVEVGQYRMRVVGVEELILDRLKAAKFWKSGRDAEQALVLFSGFRKRIDFDYLRKRAKEEGVDDVLAETASRTRSQ